jgi:VCBS repeat-containing protein
MGAPTIQLDTSTSILFVGNSYTFGRVDPVMSYNNGKVHDLTDPANGGSFTNTAGTNSYEPHPWGGVPGIFKQFTLEAGVNYDVSLSMRNAASLHGHYLNGNPGNWDLRGNVASQAWDKLVLQDNSTQALPSGGGTISFAAGSATATLTLTPVADTKVEADETVGLTLASGGGYRVGTTGKVVGTILNDDPSGPATDPSLPTVTLDANPGAVPEDSGGKLVYTFARTGPTTSALTIDFAVARDGATSPSVAASGTNADFVASGGSVYTFESGGTTTGGAVSFTNGTGCITIAAGASTATLTLVPKADTTVEADESMRFTLASNAAYNVGTQGAVTATILNDDFAPGTDLGTPNVTVNLAKSAVYEDGTEALTYQFSRSGSTASALTVAFGVDGTATLPGHDFTVAGANSFRTGGAAKPDLASFNTYAVKLAQYATTGSADGAIPANPHANAATDVYLYETWARPNLVTGALVATTDPSTGAITNTGTTAAEYYGSLEDMTADLRAAYEGLAAANPLFKGVAPVGAAFLAAVQDGVAIRDPYTTPPGTDGKVDLWWDDNLHASKYGSYLSALTLFGTITGVDPRSLGEADKAAADLGIDAATAGALQTVAAATLGLSLQAHWTAPGHVTELTGATTGTLASAGSFSFSDADTTAVHTVSAAPSSPGTLGTLAVALHGDSTGDGTGGAVNWTYTVDDSAVESLGEGETKVETFTVTLADQHGGTAQKTITVTIHGTNDAPVVTGPVQGAATGNGAPVTLDALANAADPDHGAVLSAVGLPTALPDGVSYDAAHHSFTLDPTAAAYRAMPAGTVRTVTVAYGVSDGIAAPVAASAVFTVAADATAPAALGLALAHDTGPDGGDLVTADASLVVTPAEGGGALATRVDGQAVTAYDPTGLADGVHTVSVTQTDAAGNVSDAATLRFTLDRAAPDAHADAAALTGIATAAAGNLLQNDADATPLHLGAVSYGLHTVALTPGGHAVLAGRAGLLNVAADGRYTYTPTAAGHDVFVETVVDAAGNASQTTLTVDVAKAPVPEALSLPFALTEATFDFNHGHALVTAPDGTVTDLTGIGTLTFRDGVVHEKDGSPLVDDLFYYAHNLDVWRAQVDADDHYAQFGWKEGRDPNAAFSTQTYLAANPDVAQAGVNPLTHYDTFGWKEGRSPGPDFSAEYYRARYADVDKAGVDPLRHYLAYAKPRGAPPIRACGSPTTATTSTATSTPPSTSPRTGTSPRRPPPQDTGPTASP